MGSSGRILDSNFTLQMQKIPTKKKPAPKPASKSKKPVAEKQPLPHSLQAFHQRKLYGSNPISNKLQPTELKVKKSLLKSIDKSLTKSGAIQSSVQSTQASKETRQRKRKSAECSRSNTALSSHLVNVAPQGHQQETLCQSGTVAEDSQQAS